MATRDNAIRKRRNRTRQGGAVGADDPYGSQALNDFLRQYKRVTVPSECRPIDREHLMVWLNRQGVWERADVSKLW